MGPLQSELWLDSLLGENLIRPSYRKRTKKHLIWPPWPVKNFHKRKTLVQDPSTQIQLKFHPIGLNCKGRPPSPLVQRQSVPSKSDWKSRLVGPWLFNMFPSSRQLPSRRAWVTCWSGGQPASCAATRSPPCSPRSARWTTPPATCAARCRSSSSNSQTSPGQYSCHTTNAWRWKYSVLTPRAGRDFVLPWFLRNP